MSTEMPSFQEDDRTRSEEELQALKQYYDRLSNSILKVWRALDTIVNNRLFDRNPPHEYDPGLAMSECDPQALLDIELSNLSDDDWNEAESYYDYVCQLRRDISEQIRAERESGR